jgi:hypothetical protein
LRSAFWAHSVKGRPGYRQAGIELGNILIVAK